VIGGLCGLAFLVLLAWTGWKNIVAEKEVMNLAYHAGAWWPVSACSSTRPWILIFISLPMRLFSSCRQHSQHLRLCVFTLDLESAAGVPAIDATDLAVLGRLVRRPAFTWSASNASHCRRLDTRFERGVPMRNILFFPGKSRAESVCIMAVAWGNLTR